MSVGQTLAFAARILVLSFRAARAVKLSKRQGISPAAEMRHLTNAVGLIRRARALYVEIDIAESKLADIDAMLHELHLRQARNLLGPR